MLNVNVFRNQPYTINIFSELLTKYFFIIAVFSELSNTFPFSLQRLIEMYSVTDYFSK